MYILNFTENSDYGVHSSVKPYETADEAKSAMEEDLRSYAKLLNIPMEKTETGDDEDNEQYVSLSETTGAIKDSMDSYSWTIHHFPEYVRVKEG